MKYSGIHRKLNRLRGKASEYLCFCGQQASEWAYDNVDRGLVSHHGVLYSDDINHYKAMCNRCHRILDKSKITHCPSGHEYNKNNTIIDAGKRKCRTCVYARNRARPMTQAQKDRKVQLQKNRRQGKQLMEQL